MIIPEIRIKETVKSQADILVYKWVYTIFTACNHTIQKHCELRFTVANLKACSEPDIRIRDAYLVRMGDLLKILQRDFAFNGVLYCDKCLPKQKQASLKIVED